VSFKLFGCEFPEGGDQPKHVGTRYGKIFDIPLTVHLSIALDNDQVDAQTF